MQEESLQSEMFRNVHDAVLVEASDEDGYVVVRCRDKIKVYMYSDESQKFAKFMCFPVNGEFSYSMDEIVQMLQFTVEKEFYFFTRNVV